MKRQFLSLPTLAITHLKQLTDKLNTLKQSDLLLLDQSINTYLLKRKELKSIPYAEQSFESKIRGQLLQLQEKNDYLMKELDIMTRNYEKEKESVNMENQKFVDRHEEFVGENGYEDLINELLQELAPFKKISEYVQRLQNLKQENYHKEIMACNAQQYFEKVDQIIGENCYEQERLGNDLQESYF